MKGKMRQSSSSDFTIVLPVRGTELELRLMDKSIPSAVALGPGEIIFGCDEDIPQHVLQHISDLAERNGFTRYRILQVKRDPAWGFQLAHVIWTCYCEAKFDKMLSFDVDSSVREDVMIGYDIVGADTVACCSFTKKLFIKTPLDLQRYLWYRLRVRVSSDVFSGIFWVYRPYYFEIMDKKSLMLIRNGIDTAFRDALLQDERYKLVTRKEIGCDCYDYQNDDYDWKQFQYGIWMYANHGGTVHDRISRTWIGRFLNRHPYLGMHVRSFCLGYPYLRKGYLWARNNPGHSAVQKASGMTRTDWEMLGMDYLKTVPRRWRDADRTGAA